MTVTKRRGDRSVSPSRTSKSTSVGASSKVVVLDGAAAKSSAAAAAGSSNNATSTKKMSALPAVDYVRLVTCIAGINVFYLYYGILQENLFRPDARIPADRFDNTLVLFGIQCAVNAIVALLGRSFFGGSIHAKSLGETAKTSPYSASVKLPGWAWLALVSGSYLAAMLTSNEALKYVSYPFQALAKSCKMVPVMLGNVLIGVRYRWHQYLAVMMITSGILMFQYQSGGGGGKKKSGATPHHHGQGGGDGSGQDELYGLALLFLSLVLDGVTGSNQHLFDKEFKLSTHDLMLGMNIFSALYCAIAAVVTGEGVRGAEYLASHHWIIKDVILFSLCSAMGQNFIFYTITGFGPLVCTTITTTRKFFTILISVFSHPDNRLEPKQWAGVALVFAGLGAEILEKFLQKPHRHPSLENGVKVPEGKNGKKAKDSDSEAEDGVLEVDVFDETEKQLRAKLRRRKR